MKDTTRDPANTPDPKAFERMREFTRRLIAVPKSEMPTKRKPKRPKQ